ncbi:MAG: tRNA (guanosine(46)-N7)-methyltransferase TrmB [Deltaproteobacteria bacterium]|nr:tRNA (guanosine(46)-N7)-methyltransferase TrmB [Deltaproteobacteria bacterium]
MAYAIGTWPVKKERIRFDALLGRSYGAKVSDLDLRRLYREQAPRAPEGRFSLEDLIAGSGPLELDIGFGRGLSLFERVAAAPESRIVGIEVKSKLAYKAAERLRKHEIEKVKILCGDAREILRRAEPGRSVQRVALHFPDPWWKKRHDKRRVIGQELLGELARLMKPGGELFIQTDVEHRAAQYRAQLLETPGFTLATGDGYVDENPFGARSNREKRALEDGLPVWRILAMRD